MTTAGEAQREELARLFGSLSDDAAGAEMEAAVLVSQALAPDLDVSALEGRLQQLIASCDRPEQPWVYLRELGFRGSRRAHSALTSSRMDTVLDERTGIPISLGVLLIHLARSQGLSTWGVNFPGHFLVSIEDQLVDPFEMQCVSAADCLARLPASQRVAGAAERSAFARAPARAVALRMLNNLKYQFVAEAQWHRALDMLDFQLSLAPDDTGLLFERGEFWLRLGALAPARASLERCLSVAEAGSEIAELAERQLQALAGQDDTLH